MDDEDKLEFLQEVKSEVKNQYHFMLGWKELLEVENDKDPNSVERGNNNTKEIEANTARSEEEEEDDNEDVDMGEKEETKDEKEEDTMELHSNLGEETGCLDVEGAGEEK